MKSMKSILIKRYSLPRPARVVGEKKELKPGEKIWCLEYGTLVYQYGYGSEDLAIKSLKIMQRNGDPLAQPGWKDRVPCKVIL